MTLYRLFTIMRTIYMRRSYIILPRTVIFTFGQTSSFHCKKPYANYFWEGSKLVRFIVVNIQLRSTQG
jgi:hypothetical protein